MHPVEDIGISPSPEDVVEFSSDAYGHWKRVGVKQLYNQVSQTVCVSQFQFQSQFQSQLESVGDKKPAAERRLGPSETHS